MRVLSFCSKSMIDLIAVKMCKSWSFGMYFHDSLKCSRSGKHQVKYCEIKRIKVEIGVYP